jgi:hypothetical protein
MRWRLSQQNGERANMVEILLMDSGARYGADDDTKRGLHWARAHG